MYTKYFSSISNGDNAQSILIFFSCSIAGGEQKVDGDETLEFKFFPLNKMPPLFSQQHERLFYRLVRERVGVYR